MDPTTPLGNIYFAPQAGILIWNIAVIQKYLGTCEETSERLSVHSKGSKDVHTHYQYVAGTSIPNRLLFGEDSRLQRCRGWYMLLISTEITAV